MAKSSAPNSAGQRLPVRPRRATAVKIGLAYAVMGVLWVSVSSLLLHHLVADRHQADTLDWVNDFCFAVFMAGTLGFLLDRYFKQLRRSAQKLRESEERWQYALEGAGHGVWDWNPQTNEVHYSDQWKRMLGYAPQEIASRLQEWESRVHPDDLPLVLKSLQRHIAGETAEYRAEHRIRCKDGSYKWILDQGKVMRRAPDGKPLRVLGTHTDISDRKVAEAALAAQKHQLDHFFDSAIDLLCIADHNSRFLRLNQEWEKLLGYSREEMLGRPFLDFVHPEDLLATEAALAGLANNEPILNFVNRYRAKDGSYRFIEWRSLPSGGLIYATARDVTRRMQLEAALRESEVRQSIAIEAAELGLWEWDLVANKVVWSEQHHRLWGFAPGEFKGTPEEFTSRLHPDDLAGLSAAGDASRSANRPFKCEFRAFIKDGSMRWFASHGRYLFAPDGQALRIVGVAFDITERKLAEETLRVGRQRLQLAMSAARMGAWEFDFQTSQLQWSDEIFQVLGLAKQPVSREFLGGLIHAEDRELLDVAMQTAIATRSPYKAEYRVLTNGKLFWVDDRGEVQFASDGRPLRATGVALDITERKMAEQALRLAHDRNAVLVQLGRQLAEASSPRLAGLAILEAARQLLGWDCAWLREIDVPNQAWQDLAIFDLVEGERRECTSDPSSMLRPSPVIRRAMTEGQLVLRQQENEGEQSLVRFGSGRRSLSLVFVPLRHLGKLIGMLSIQSYQAQAYDEAGVKLLQELADHCAGAVERTRVEAALQARQEIFQSIVTQAPDAIVLVDGGTGRFLEFNTAAHEGLGYTREEFSRMSITEIQADHSPAQIHEILQRNPSQGGLVFETCHRRRDGAIREVRVSVRALAVAGANCTASVWSDITDRKRAERALQQSEAEFRAIFEVASIGVAEADPQTSRWIRVNQKLCQITGYSAPEMLQLRVPEITHPDDWQRDAELFQNVIRGELASYQIEKRYIRRDGLIVWVRVNMTVIRDAVGEPLRTIATIEDITQRKHGEDALRDNLLFRRQAEKIARIGAWKVSPKTDYLFWTEGVYDIVEAPLDYKPGLREGLEFYDPAYIPRLQEALGRALTEGSPFVLETPLTTMTGKKLWTEVRGLGRVFEGEEPYVMGTFQDITERRRAEEALRESEERFRKVVEITPEAIFVRTKEQFAYVNPAALRLFGAAAPEELIGKSVMDRFAPEFRDEIRARMQALDERGAQTAAADHVFLRLDGRPLNVSVDAFPFVFQGHPSALVFARDVTALKQSAKRAEQEAFRTELLLNLHQRAPQLTDQELYNYVLEKAVQLTESTIGFFHQVSADQQSILLTTWNGEALRNCTAAFATHYPLREAGNWVDCVREQRPVVYNDFAHSPNQRGLPVGHTVIQRFMSIPVIKDGKARIIFGVGNKPEAYGEFDKSQLQLVANELHKIMVQREAQHQVHQLSLAVEQSPAMVVITNPRGHVEYVNQRFIEVVGFTLEEMRGQMASALRAEYHTPEQFQDLWQSIQRSEQWQGEVLGCRKTGERFWEAVKVSPIKHPDGTIANLLVLKEDITQRRRVAALQQALLTLGEKLNATSDPLSAARALFASADEIWKWDSGTLHLLAEDRNQVEPVLQIDVLDGRRLELPAEERIPLSPRMARVIKQGAELILRDPTTPAPADSRAFGDVNRLSAAIMCVPVRRENSVVGVLSLQSYTPRAYGPDDLRFLQALADYCAGALNRMRSETALQASQERYRGLVETTLDWVWERDAEGRYTYASPKVLDILGYPPEQVVGKTPFDFMLPEEARRVSGVFKELVSRCAPFSSLENTNRHSNGRLVLLETSGVPVLDGSGRLLGYRGMDRDVTERRQLEDQLRQAQKLEAIGQLAGGVAHDFNNILAATMMHLSLLQTNPSVDQEVRAALKELDAEARRAAALTRQLLAFSRRSVLSVKPLDMNEMVGNLLKMLSRLIGEHIKLTFESGSNLPAVEADAGMMEQVLMNLVVNARDAMPKGGAIEIATSVTQWNSLQAAMNTNRRPGRFVCLRVTDHGMGMSADILQRIFEPFFTTKELGKGTGLGLATVHGIVAQHQGWVEVDSAVGQGTAFRVYLPVLEQVALNSRENPVPAPIQRGHETILVVEDETRVRRVLAHLLRTLGYQVHEAANGQEAMKVWQIHGDQIELLFTDMVMPEGMTGLELTEQLQALKPNLKAIISSGYSAELGDVGWVGRAGIIYLPKPYDAGSAAKIIRECLERKG